MNQMEEKPKIDEHAHKRIDMIEPEVRKNTQFRESVTAMFTKAVGYARAIVFLLAVQAMGLVETLKKWLL